MRYLSRWRSPSSCLKSTHRLPSCCKASAALFDESGKFASGSSSQQYGGERERERGWVDIVTRGSSSSSRLVPPLLLYDSTPETWFVEPMGGWGYSWKLLPKISEVFVCYMHLFLGGGRDKNKASNFFFCYWLSFGPPTLFRFRLRSISKAQDNWMNHRIN